MDLSNSRNVVKYLIWAYFFLLIFDGALRKWFFTPLSDVLLLSRIPVTFLIYCFALQGRFFVVNSWVFGAVILALATGSIAMLLHGNAIIAAFGIITNYASIPLIFIIPKVFNYYDVEKMGKVMLLLVLPMTLLIGLQFYSPQEAWVNKGVGGETGTGFHGALDKYRPPGTFSFITGLAQFYTLAFAFYVAQFINHRTFPISLLYLVGASFILSVYLSISRLLALSVLIVFAAGILGLILNGRRIGNTLKIGMGLIIAYVIASQLPVFDAATEAFLTRWENSTGEEAGGVQEAIFMRSLSSFTAPITSIDFLNPLGQGIGIGTNVGAKLAVGERAFLAGEGEWSRIMAELGPAFGLIYILYRTALIIYLLSTAYRTLKKGNFLPWLIYFSCAMIIINGQWGQQSIHGFAILSAGLILSAGRLPVIRENLAKTKTIPVKEQKMSLKQPQMS